MSYIGRLTRHEQIVDISTIYVAKVIIYVAKVTIFVAKVTIYVAKVTIYVEEVVFVKRSFPL